MPLLRLMLMESFQERRLEEVFLNLCLVRAMAKMLFVMAQTQKLLEVIRQQLVLVPQQQRVIVQ